MLPNSCQLLGLTVGLPTYLSRVAQGISRARSKGRMAYVGIDFTLPTFQKTAKYTRDASMSFCADDLVDACVAVQQLVVNSH